MLKTLFDGRYLSNLDSCVSKLIRAIFSFVAEKEIAQFVATIDLALSLFVDVISIV